MVQAVDDEAGKRSRPSPDKLDAFKWLRDEELDGAPGGPGDRWGQRSEAARRWIAERRRYPSNTNVNTGRPADNAHNQSARVESVARGGPDRAHREQADADPRTDGALGVPCHRPQAKVRAGEEEDRCGCHDRPAHQPIACVRRGRQAASRLRRAPGAAHRTHGAGGSGPLGQGPRQPHRASSRHQRDTHRAQRARWPLP